ncbi:response regulator [Anaerolineales bacterium HSG6]|nr:response regulator [Anaerolineales bacterium HSG6]
MTETKIMVVEDEAIIVMLLKTNLKLWGYSVSAVASSGQEAIEKAGKTQLDLVLMDINLEGGMDGVEAAEQIKTRFDIPVIYTTAYSDHETLQRAKITEPYGYLIKPYERRELHTVIEITLYKHQAERELKRYRHELEDLVTERTIELQRSNEQLQKEIDERKKAQEQLQQANTKLARAYEETLAGWGQALELRDKETRGHSDRVTEMTVRLARAMGLGETELVHIRRGAFLHDVGKMGIPDNILLKPGSFTDTERQIMRQHPTFAYQMLSSITYLQPALDIPYCHHEKWDGTGYPRGLKGEEIPLAARIFAVVDVWDALRSDRPYHNAWPKEKVLVHIQEQTGTHFDPQVVKAFLQIIEDIE